MNRLFIRAVRTQHSREFFSTAHQPTATTSTMNSFAQFSQQQQPIMMKPLNPLQQLQQQFIPQPTFRLPHINNTTPQPQQLFNENVLEFMNRNKRKPKKANHGARPCSSVARSKKKLRRHHYPK